MLKSVANTYKRSFSGLSTQTWWLSVVLLINRSGTMVVPFITIYLTQHLHYTLTQAGIVNAVFGVGSILGAYIGGRLTDKLGHSKVQLAALLGGSLFFIVLGYMQKFEWICAITFLLSVVNEAFRPANSTAIAAYSLPENRTRSYSLNRLAINIGWAVGATMGGLLAGVDYQLLFWVDGVTNFAAAILLWRVLYKPFNRVEELNEIKTSATGSSPWRDKVYIRFIVLVTVFASCFMLTFRIVPVFYKEEFHLSEALIGFILGLNGIIIALFEMVLVTRWEGKRGHLVYIRLGYYLCAVAYLLLLLPLNAVFVAVLSILMLTACEILAFPFMNTFWIGRTSEANRGSYAAVYTIAWSIAQIAGPYVGALVVDYFGYQPLWIGAAVVAVACAVFIYFLRENKETTVS